MEWDTSLWKTAKIREQLELSASRRCVQCSEPHQPQHAKPGRLLFGGHSTVKLRRSSYEHFDHFAAAAGFGEADLVMTETCTLPPRMCFRRLPGVETRGGCQLTSRVCRTPIAVASEGPNRQGN